MTTLAEIETAVGALTPEERELLERRLRALNKERSESGKVFTGNDAVRWWRERERMPEAEAFAADVETARRELNLPPAASSWES